MKRKQGVNIVFRGVLCPKFDTPQASGTERRFDAVVETHRYVLVPLLKHSVKNEPDIFSAVITAGFGL
ncbi:hypothetical protein M9458_053843, partial [Cirrhinus mrigala]